MSRRGGELFRLSRLRSIWCPSRPPKNGNPKYRDLCAYKIEVDYQMSSSPREYNFPNPRCIRGEFVSLEPICQVSHAEHLDRHVCGRRNVDLWTYIPFGPFEKSESLFSLLEHTRKNLGWVSFAICVEGEAKGTISLLRIRREHGSAEVGAIVLGKELQKTPASTEALYLLTSYVFDHLKYRRLEWKCDDRNIRSKKAAKRFGFQFEGMFRKDMIVKGQNRNTAWYAMIDTDWRTIKLAYDEWLSPSNFSAGGRQRRNLKVLIDERLLGFERRR